MRSESVSQSHINGMVVLKSSNCPNKACLYFILIMVDIYLYYMLDDDHEMTKHLFLIDQEQEFQNIDALASHGNLTRNNVVFIEKSFKILINVISSLFTYNIVYNNNNLSIIILLFLFTSLYFVFLSKLLYKN